MLEPAIAKRLTQVINQQLPKLNVYWADYRLHVEQDNGATLITIYLTKKNNRYYLDYIDFSNGWQEADPTTCDYNELPMMIKLLKICYKTK